MTAVAAEAPAPSLANRLAHGAALIATEFAPLLIFYAAYKTLGVKPAIALSWVVTLAEVAYKCARKQRLTGFFRFSVFLTLLFGGIDLYLKQSFLYRYEGVLINVTTAAWFAATLCKGKPIIQEFAERELPPGVTLEPQHLRYIRALTGVWVLSFLAKAAFYFWQSYNGVSFDEIILVRMSVGPLSFVTLIIGERLLRPVILPLF